jgi:hypothetical protein
MMTATLYAFGRYYDGWQIRNIFRIWAAKIPHMCGILRHANTSHVMNLCAVKFPSWWEFEASTRPVGVWAELNQLGNFPSYQPDAPWRVGGMTRVSIRYGCLTRCPLARGRNGLALIVYHGKHPMPPGAWAEFGADWIPRYPFPDAPWRVGGILDAPGESARPARGLISPTFATGGEKLLISAPLAA